MIPAPVTLSDWLALGIGILFGVLASIPMAYAATAERGHRRRYWQIVDYEPVDDYEPVITIERPTVALLTDGTVQHV